MEREARGTASDSRWRHWLLLLLALSLALRVLWLLVRPAVIESEGAYYARLGENIAAGRGYVGIREAGLQILYPPLFPGLIAAGVRLGLTSELAGRLVSLLFGALFPWVVASTGRYLYGQRAGLLAGLLAAIHPLLIAISAAVLTESTYLTLALLAASFTMRALQLERRRDAILAGLLFGLAYLTRPEALFLAGLACLAVVGLNLGRLGLAFRRAALLAATCVALACIYIVPLSHQVGHFRFEAKTPEATAFATRLARGEPVGEVYLGIDDALHETGLANMSNLEVIESTNAPLVERLSLMARQARHGLPDLLRRLGGGLFLGGPMLIALVALGLFADPWTGERARRELVLLMMVALPALTFSTWPFSHDRFLFPFMMVLVLWSGAGLARLLGWGSQSAGQLRLRAGWQRLAAAAAVGVALLLVCGSAAVGVDHSDELSQAWSDLAGLRSVGEWLAARSHRPFGVFDTGPTIAFYAGGVLLPLPYCDGPTALRYLASKGPDYVVLRSSDNPVPYYREWLESGIPDARAHLLRTFSVGQGERVVVYAWSSGPGDN